MVKCVQNPLKGLFVRYYLNQMLKDFLPVPGSFYSMKNFVEKEINDELPSDEIEKLNKDDLELAIDYLLTNLQEMNRLWIRIQYYSNNKDDRKDLETIIGFNFNMLSNIDSIDVT